VTALFLGYTEIRVVLNELSDDNTQTQTKRREANNVTNKMNEFHMALMTVIWH